MTPAKFLEQLTPAARRRFGSDKRWAAACGLPAETLSRLRKRKSCDLQTLNALAYAAGHTLTLASEKPLREGSFFGREEEEALLDLCASGNTEPPVWRNHGDGFLVGGLAMMLASTRGFDRRRYIGLAEELHPGISQPEVFQQWLERTPVRAARFLPMLERWKKNAA